MMVTYLDLDDVAAGHPRAIEELAELRLAAERYETATLTGVASSAWLGGNFWRNDEL